LIPPQLSSPADLADSLEKLQRHPGSLVPIAIEMAEPVCNYCRTSVAWISQEERKVLKAGLERAR
jgi:hypothetical protein